MSSKSDIDLAPEYAEDWIPQAPEDHLTKVAVTTDAGYLPKAVEVTSPNGTRVVITADPITGGLRVAQDPDSKAERGMLSTVAMGLGTILLDDRP